MGLKLSAVARMLIVTVLLIHLLIRLATSSPSSLSPRKSTSEDPYIVCRDPTPLASIPDGYLLAWYPTTAALCSARNGAARNVGCVWFAIPPPSLPLINSC